MSYKVCLEVFEGPLDLLLYLIKKEELDIYNIPIARITAQYLDALEVMETLDLNIAGDFLVMAATLMQIKSRMLLPVDPENTETDEADPREELVRRLLEYKAFKESAEILRGFEEKRSDRFNRAFRPEPWLDEDALLLDVSLWDLVSAFSKALKDLPKTPDHEVLRDEFTVAQKIEEIQARLVERPSLGFSGLFRKAKDRLEAITLFLALLELVRLKKIKVSQSTHFGEIEIARME